MLQIEELKQTLDDRQLDQRQQVSELTSELRRLTSDRDRVSAEMEKVTSRMGECKGMRSKFEKDKRDLKNLLLAAGRALQWNIDEVATNYKALNKLLIGSKDGKAQR